MKVVLVGLAEPWPIGYVEDAVTAYELSRLGITTRLAGWDDPDFAIEPDEIAVIRTTWNYHLYAPSFLSWVDDLERQGVRVLNDPTVIRWNADKRYLRELAAAGVRIPETYFLEAGEAFDLGDRWPEAVVKPAVSAGAHGTYRTAGGVVRPEVPTLVQPYLPEIQHGEWSLFYFGGEFSHAVLKEPKLGDYRVQEEFGGRSTLADPPTDALAAAPAILAAIPGPWLFSRVDGVMVGGQFTLMELELIEPQLYFHVDPWAARRLGQALLRF